MRADGAGDTVRLTENRNAQQPRSFSPDGKILAYTEYGVNIGHIWTLPLDLSDPDHPRPGKPELFRRTPAGEGAPAFSPDGRWLAYPSAESGVHEVYVLPFPASSGRSGGKWQISSGGGMNPIWSRNGRELFYRTTDGLIMVATYAVKGGVFSADKPRPWSKKPVPTKVDFDLAPDGKRFAVVEPVGAAEDEQTGTQVTFLLNFFDELRRKAPASGKAP